MGLTSQIQSKTPRASIVLHVPNTITNHNANTNDYPRNPTSTKLQPVDIICGTDVTLKPGPH